MGLFTRKVVEVKDAVAGKSGFGVPTHYAFSKRRFNYGEGANVYAFDTLALPMYTPIGWGVANKQTFMVTRSAPVVEIAHGVPLDSLGNPGILSGQFVSQPLLDPNNAGMMLPNDPRRNILNEGSQS